MPIEFHFKGRWAKTKDGFTYVGKAIDERDSTVHAIVRVSVPVTTAVDFAEIFGDTLRMEIEKAARGIAKNIVSKEPR